MAGPLHRFMTEDHKRLDALLRKAESGGIDPAAYGKFREGLLRHIAMEEKVLLPEAQRLRGGRPLPIASQLRLDHSALAALLVPSPTQAVVAAIKAILSAHNRLEEGAGGLYEACEELTAAGVEELLSRLRALPRVPVSPHADGSKVLAATRRTLIRAGHTDLAKTLDGA